jgi:hypothetical protein
MAIFCITIPQELLASMKGQDVTCTLLVLSG